MRERTGLTCSIGVAPNKLLAKIASELDKPDGLTCSTTTTSPARIWPLPARKINGIGPKASAKLAALGITPSATSPRADPAWLVEHFGTQLRRLAARGRRTAATSAPVVTDSEPKSISRETTFERDLHAVRDRAELGAIFTELCEQRRRRPAAQGLRRQDDRHQAALRRLQDRHARPDAAEPHRRRARRIRRAAGAVPEARADLSAPPAPARRARRRAGAPRRPGRAARPRARRGAAARWWREGRAELQSAAVRAVMRHGERRRRGARNRGGAGAGRRVSLGLARFSYALLLPPMRADLGWSCFTAGAMNTVNAAGYLLGALLLPRLLRRFDARRVLLAGSGGAGVLLALHGRCVRRLRRSSRCASLTGVGQRARVRRRRRAARGAARSAPPGAGAGRGAGLMLGIYYGGTGDRHRRVARCWCRRSRRAGAHAWQWAWMALGGGGAAGGRGDPRRRRAVSARRRGRRSGGAPRFARRAVRLRPGRLPLFGLGYIGYMTFIVTLLREQRDDEGHVSSRWNQARTAGRRRAQGAKRRRSEAVQVSAPCAALCAGAPSLRVPIAVSRVQSSAAAPSTMCSRPLPGVRRRPCGGRRHQHGADDDAEPGAAGDQCRRRARRSRAACTRRTAELCGEQPGRHEHRRAGDAGGEGRRRAARCRRAACRARAAAGPSPHCRGRARRSVAASAARAARGRSPAALTVFIEPATVAPGPGRRMGGSSSA